MSITVNYINGGGSEYSFSWPSGAPLPKIGELFDPISNGGSGRIADIQWTANISSGSVSSISVLIRAN